MLYNNITNQGENPATMFPQVTRFGYETHIFSMQDHFSPQFMNAMYDTLDDDELDALSYAWAVYASDVPTALRSRFAASVASHVTDFIDFCDIEDGSFGEQIFLLAVEKAFFAFISDNDLTSDPSAYDTILSDADRGVEMFGLEREIVMFPNALEDTVGTVDLHEKLFGGLEVGPIASIRRHSDWPFPFIEQPSPARYDWSYFDDYLAAVKDRSLAQRAPRRVMGRTHSEAMFVRKLRRALRRLQRSARSEDTSRLPARKKTTRSSPQLQSGASEREKREQVQRAKAAERERAKKTSVPKHERLAAIKQQRDKRNPIFQSRLRPSVPGGGAGSFFTNGAKFQVDASKVEFQSGLHLLLGTAAAVAIKGICGGIGRVVKGVERASDSIASLPGRIQKSVTTFGNELKKTFGQALWYIPLVLSLYYTWHQLSSSSPLLVTVFVTAIAAALGPRIWRLCSDFFQSRTVLQGGLQPGFGSNAPKLLTALFTFAAFKNRKSGGVTEFMKRLAILPRVADGWSTFLTWFTDSIQWCVNSLRSMFGKERMQLFAEQNGPVKAWMREVDDVRKLCWTDRSVTPTDLSRMVKVVSDGFTFKELYRNTPMGRSVETYLASIASELAPYQGALRASNNFRFEPSMLMMVGKPGVGKTLMAMPFCISVLKLSGIVPKGATTDETVSQIWQKGTSEFWNGYAGQDCLVMDDAFQAKADKTDKENDFMTIIRMISSWSFPLNFADLASKGKIYFGSKFVFGTTNLTSIVSEANNVIQEPEAVLRRIHYPVCVRVKPEYACADGKLNFSVFKSLLDECAATNKGLDAYPWHCWEYAHQDFAMGGTGTVWKPLRLLLQEVADELRQKFVYHDEQKKAIENLVNSFAEVELQGGRKVASNLLEQATATTVAEAAFLFHSEMASWKADAGIAWKFLGFVVRLFAYSAIFGLVVGIMSAVWSLLSSLFGIVISPVKSTVSRVKRSNPAKQSNIPVKSYRTKPVVPKKPSKSLEHRGRSDKVVLQGVHSKGSDSILLQAGNSSVTNNVYMNSYKMVYDTTDGGVVIVGQIVFLRDRLAVMPAHFIADVQRAHAEGSARAGQSLQFCHACNEGFDFRVSVAEFLRWDKEIVSDKEVAFVTFAVGRAHRNICANFVKEADLKYASGHPVRLDVCDVTCGQSHPEMVVRKIFVSQKLELGNRLTVEGSNVSRYFRYVAATESGDCGAPLCVYNPERFSGRVCLGIHFAGTTDQAFGYSAPVTQEMIEQAANKFSVVDDRFEEDLERRGLVYQSSYELPFAVKGSFLPIAVMDRAVSISPKSSYFVTEEYGTLGPYDHVPARLSPVKKEGEWIYPMNKAVEPYSSPLLLYEQPWLEQAVHVATRPLFGLIRERNKDIYTFEQAIRGVPEEKFRSIPRNTGCGYPYCLNHRNGKTEFFGVDDVYDLNSEACAKLRDDVTYIVDFAKENVRLAHIFMDFLKDELRTPEKVDAVMTRLISSAPLDYTIAFRMYFGAFSAACMSVPVLCGMAPGINCYSDWDMLANTLRRHGDHVFDGDFKAFDSSEQPCIHDAILKVINQWYDDGEENARIRRVLWLELTHSRHIGGTGYDQRHVYQWNKSLPSGHPFTTIVNSIYSLVLLVGAYISVTGDWTGFWENVSPVTYGDDNVVNVASGVDSIYNQRTVSEALATEFGVRYTPGDKTGEFKDFMTLTDVTFLKRSFRLEDKHWYCPLELSSFLYTAYWCKNYKLKQKIIIDDLENALAELSMHRPGLWDEYAPKIIARLRHHDTEPKCVPERRHYMAAILRRTDAWY